jgi:hypothetical protein
LFDLRRGSGSDSDTDAFAGEGKCDGATNASSAAGDQSCFNYG